MSSKREDRFPAMVGWYDPRLLARTAVQVAVSTIFGRHSDRRLVEAVGSGPMEYYDYSGGPEVRVVRHGDPPAEASDGRRRSICIDYAADVGDGWNSTYAVALAIAEGHYGRARTFRYKDEEGKTRVASPPRGDILVLGGDEVYPVASREAYETRLRGPYEAALRCSRPPHPDVYAVPGNHDWYDSLVSFTRMFGPGRWLGGWKSRQTRSYFALKLPHNWWLVGTDVQLGSDIDRPQVDYFKWIARQMAGDARVILCNAEPYWVVAEVYGQMDPEYNESNLAFLEKKVLGRRVSVFIAGDLHHYRRHESLDRSSQKITAGGGGAFLHPTHTGRWMKSRVDLLKESARVTSNPCPDGSPPPPAEPEARAFKLKASYPPEDVSRRLCWGNLVFPFLPGNASRSFGLLTSALYFLTTLAVLRAGPVGDPGDFPGFLAEALQIAWESSFTLTLAGIILAAFLLFTDTHSTRYRILMGIPHGLAHLFVAFCSAFCSIYVSKLLIQVDSMVEPALRAGLAGLLVLILGFFLGPFVLGAYLLISLNLFGRHSNEAFSSLAVQDWKSFLKLHIERDGELVIYPIGLRRVPRKWKPNPEPDDVDYVPDDPDATEPELIEDRPVRVGGAAPGAAVSERGGADG